MHTEFRTRLFPHCGFRKMLCHAKAVENCIQKKKVLVVEDSKEKILYLSVTLLIFIFCLGTFLLAHDKNRININVLGHISLLANSE